MTTDIAVATEVHFSNWLGKNRNRVIGGGVVIALVALAVSYYFYDKNQTEITASKAISKVQPGPNAADAYLKIATENPGTPAAERATLLAANELFAAGKYPDAQTQFERVATDFPGTQFRDQSALGIAASLAAQGKTADATTRYTDLIQRSPEAAAATQARASLASIYETQGKFTEAIPLYQELARAEAYSSIGLEAGVRLQALLAQHPELLAKPAAANTNANISLK
ncbi:MAG: Tetratricopeptide repeat-like domain [Verrucomicrobiota bacterium]|jgi:tetratricopeptide (TPR) repeat protein